MDLLSGAVVVASHPARLRSPNVQCSTSVQTLVHPQQLSYHVMAHVSLFYNLLYRVCCHATSAGSLTRKLTELMSGGPCQIQNFPYNPSPTSLIPC
jgi:hypothetical protein